MLVVSIVSDLDREFANQKMDEAGFGPLNYNVALTNNKLSVTHWASLYLTDIYSDCNLPEGTSTSFGDFKQIIEEAGLTPFFHEET